MSVIDASQALGLYKVCEIGKSSDQEGWMSRLVCGFFSRVCQASVFTYHNFNYVIFRATFLTLSVVYHSSMK